MNSFKVSLKGILCRKGSMYRKLIFLSLLTLLFLLSACGGSSSDGDKQPSASSGEVEENGLPPLPDFVKDKGKLVIGVKVDYPPFGFVNEDDEIDGYEIDFAKKLAEYAFGDPKALELVGVSSANRVPNLTTKKVDILIATLGITDERKEQIDFTDPYYSSGVRLLVPKDSSLTSYEELDGETVIAMKGTTGSIELEKIMPSAKQLKIDTVSQGLKALQDGRGVAFIQDDSLLFDIAEKNSKLKVVSDPFGKSLWGIGVRKGEEEWLNWLNAAIEKTKEEDLFYTWFKKWYPNAELVPEDLPRP